MLYEINGLPFALEDDTSPCLFETGSAIIAGLKNNFLIIYFHLLFLFLLLFLLLCNLLGVVFGALSILFIQYSQFSIYSIIKNYQNGYIKIPDRVSGTNTV